MDAEMELVGIGKNRIQRIGELVIRYGLVLVLAWIGAMKFTAYEAAGIKGLVETSPFLSFTLGDSIAGWRKAR